MISDRFDLQRAAMGGSDEMQGRIGLSNSNETSNESFVSTSLNQENFGDWGSFTDSKKPISFSYRQDRVDEDPFAEQKEEIQHSSANLSGFTLIELKSSVPKLPVSKREIRKGNSSEQTQPTIIFQTPLEGEEDLAISPIGSPVAASMRNYSTSRFQGQPLAEPTRVIKRSVSDIGSFNNIDLSSEPEDDEDEISNPPSPSKRSMFSAQKGSEMSLSFSQRRRPFANRALLMQIGARRKSYRQLSMDDDDDQDAPPSPSLHRPQPELEGHSTPHPPPQPINFSSDDSADFEGTMPLKAEPEPTMVKKRSTSKDRLKKSSTRNSSNRNHQDDPEMDDFPQPSRKSSLSTSRRSKSRKGSLNDSYRSHGSTQSNNSRKSLRRSNSEEYGDVTNLTAEQERSSLLADVRRMRSARRLSEGGARRNRSSSRKRLAESRHGKSKKKTDPEEKQHTSRCKNRKSAARRASMTGNIVETEEEFNTTKRRSSMGHLRSNHRPKERTQRRATMDHFTPSSPSSATCSPSEHMKPRSKADTLATLSSRDMTLSTHMDEQKSPFSAPLLFGEEETETTKETQGTGELSNSFRQISRKSSMGKHKEHRQSKGRTKGRSRSELERKRSSSKQRQQDYEQQDKTVTVAEILAVVASANKDVSPRQRTRKKVSRSNHNPIDLSSRSAGSAKSSSQSDKSRGRNPGSPRSKSRKSRSNSRFQSIRKGKRVDNQDVPPESPRRTKDKPMVVGKEGRNRWGGRRLSAR